MSLAAVGEVGNDERAPAAAALVETSLEIEAKSLLDRDREPVAYNTSLMAATTLAVACANRGRYTPEAGLQSGPSDSARPLVPICSVAMVASCRMTSLARRTS